MKIGATPWLIIKGAALIVSGFLAAIGMTFICWMQSYAFARTHDVFDIGDRTPAVVYVILFTLMVAWVVIACIFAWCNRTRLGLALSAIAFIVFAMSAHNIYSFAYPVCNAF